MKQIFIVEDEIIVAKNIAGFLEEKGYSIAGIANEYNEAIKKLLVCRPNLILCDINLTSEKNGIDLMRELGVKYNTPFVFISAYSDEQTLKNAETTAPCNFLTKPFSEKQLLTTVKRAFAQIEAIRLEYPSGRGLSILKLIGRGYSTKQIAEELSISFNTVESHRKNLIKKYQVNSMAELICLATTNGWIKYGM